MGSKMRMRDGEDRAWAPCTPSRSLCIARHQTQMKNASKHDATHTRSRTASRRNGLENQEKNQSNPHRVVHHSGGTGYVDEPTLPHASHPSGTWVASHWSDCSQASMRALLPPTSSFQSFLSSPLLSSPRTSKVISEATDSIPAQRSIPVLLILEASYSLLRLYVLLSSRSGRIDRKVASVVCSCPVGRVTRVLFVVGSREADQRPGSCLKMNYCKMISI